MVSGLNISRFSSLTITPVSLAEAVFKMSATSPSGLPERESIYLASTVSPGIAPQRNLPGINISSSLSHLLINPNVLLSRTTSALKNPAASASTKPLLRWHMIPSEIRFDKALSKFLLLPFLLLHFAASSFWGMGFLAVFFRKVKILFL